jgi:hypothetical protein
MKWSQKNNKLPNTRSIKIYVQTQLDPYNERVIADCLTLARGRGRGEDPSGGTRFVVAYQQSHWQ